MCGELKARARMEHSSMYNVFTWRLAHSAKFESLLLLLLLTLGMRLDAASCEQSLPHCLFCEDLSPRSEPTPALLAEALLQRTPAVRR